MTHGSNSWAIQGKLKEIECGDVLVVRYSGYRSTIKAERSQEQASREREGREIVRQLA